MQSNPCRTPGFLRVSPVDPGKQIGKLRRRDRHHTIGRRRPYEPAPFEPLREQAGPLAIMPDQFYQIAAAAPEAEQMTAQRIMLQHLLHTQCQRREPAPHIRVARRQPNPNACRDRDHRRASRPWMMRSNASTSTSRSTMTRRPFALSTSMRPPADKLGETGAGTGDSGTTSAGTKPSKSPPASRPSRYARRHVFNSERESPYLRAVADPSRGAE